MMKIAAPLQVITVLASCLGLAWANHAPAQVQQPKAAAKQAVEFFESKIRPVFVERCIRCHGPEKQKANLRLDSAAAMLQGGLTGPAVVPVHPEKSLLIEAIHQKGDLKMPPDGKLPAETI